MIHRAVDEYQDIIISIQIKTIYLSNLILQYGYLNIETLSVKFTSDSIQIFIIQGLLFFCS